MASSSGNSSENISSEKELQNLINERKRKRMQSNRESARRSRMRKQKHLDDLMAQVDQLRKENNQILTSINITTEQFLNVEAENSVIRAQMVELSQRLESLNEILSYMNTNNNNGIFENGEIQTSFDCMMMMNNNLSWNLMYQPSIIASAEPNYLLATI
ncbi:DNA-binding transcription factor [Lithospermum erythrorhizon]|uniref:DNA-binding transcription factor n=1 Tax=Lithospermum erythrorhizon TaxID=34254 RepID=A0AAV3NRS1_LITER